MVSDPKWHDKTIEALENTIELLSPGALSYAVGEDGHALAVAPSLLAHEEQGTVFSLIELNASGFAKVFDNPPSISWRT